MYPDYNSHQQYQQYPADTARVGSLVNSTMKRVYFKMTLGLIVTAVVSLLCTAPNTCSSCKGTAGCGWR